MDLSLTVVDAAGATADIHVAAPDLAPAAGLLATVRSTLSVGVGVPLSIDGRLLLADGAVADCGLTAGTIVVAGEPAAAPTGPVELIVGRGPDAGRRWTLAAGDHDIGRDPHCELTLADQAVSRRHLRLTVRSTDVQATDLASANGTRVDGSPVPPQTAVEVSPGRPIAVGASEIVIHAALAPDVAAANPPVQPAPRLGVAAPTVEIAFPAQPLREPSRPLPVLAALAPLVAGVVLAVVLKQWQFLAFTVLSPVMVLGQAGSDRWSSRQAARTARREHARVTEVARRSLARALAAERIRRRQASPDLGTLTRAAAHRTEPLWQRSAHDPDALTLRLGSGDLPSDIRITGDAPRATAVDVPVCLALHETIVAGISGPPECSAGLVRSMVIQAATLLSPADLRVVVLAPGGAGDWAWLRWLPHLAPHDGEPCSALVGFDDEQAARRVQELIRRDDIPAATSRRTLVVADVGPAAATSRWLADLLDHEHPGVSVLVRTDRAHDLPRACRTVLGFQVAHPPVCELTIQGGDTIRPDLLAADTAERTARALSPLRSGQPIGRAMPQSVPWSVVSDIDVSGPADAVRSLARQWSLAASTEVVLGRDRDGRVRIDLGRDGPHALIAGTTGSGKSELLVSLVASLAARNRPDHLSLLLIDHKGGAALGRCARLPHAVGLVTDLDAVSTRRALLSLTAEVRRREALFAAAGAGDLAAYSRSSAGTEPLARLVIVVDEFAALAEEQPDFVGGLVGIAQRGRSLGIHLILATQRPDGVVSADIRANTRLRICLGVARDNESRDVIDSPLAASISRTTPGRGYLRIGPGELREFQVAHLGGPTSGSATTVVLSPAETLGEPPARPAIDDATGLDTLAAAAVRLATALGVQTPPPPWLPPLPELIPVATLPAVGPDQMAWGLVDLPALGAQKPLTFDLHAGGSTLIAGAARSGRTSAAMTLAVTAAARRTADQLVVWAVDAGGGLADLAALPHCAAVVPGRDADRVERMLAHLAGEVTRRRHDPGSESPAMLLLIDSWEGLGAAVDDRDSGRLQDGILRLATEGPSAGLHVVITSDRAGLVGRLAAATAQKIVLRLADPGDFALVGLPARDVPRHLPAGRGIRSADLAVVQIGRLDDRTLADARAGPAPRRAPQRFDPLPRTVALADLVQPSGARAGQVVLGLAADSLEPVRLDPTEIGTSFVVAGGPGSGRTTALLLLAGQLTARPLATSCPRGSPLLGLAGAIELPRDDQTHAAAILDSLSDADCGYALLVDDVDRLADGPLTERLESLIRASAGASDEARVIAIAGATDSLAAAFRGPMAAARRARTGLLLRPASRHDGDLFGLSVASRSRFGEPPGRGWLSIGGMATALQLADPGGPAGGRSAGGGRVGLQVGAARLLG